MRTLIPVFIVLTGLAAPRLQLANAATMEITPRLHHLRSGDNREWAEFPESAEAQQLLLKFRAIANASESTLQLRQQDVKQSWTVTLNGQQLGRLQRNENDLVIRLAIPAMTLKTGENILVVKQGGRGDSDDIRVGEIVLDDRPLEQTVNAGRASITVVDADGKERIPCRITIVDENGALATVGAQSSTTQAVRPGVVYSANGSASFGLPTGTYTIYAGRGFEWSVDSVRVTVFPGDQLDRKLSIRRVVDTAGYVACDTHVHTLTHSGHGDASLEERLITLAGEGIEFPIATDHNVHIDYTKPAKLLKVDPYFTPVMGNEFTTKLGHFNIFPVRTGAPTPDHQLSDWKSLFAAVYETPNVRAVILNHARDIHSGNRPFGPRLFNAATGEHLEGWKLRANAMELINSGATQSDPMQLYRDWFTLMNRGTTLTPVGSSDSHDVARYIVGQGRTYIRCNDSDVGKINTKEAIDSFVQGRVNVSYGLLTELEANGNYGPGELATTKGDVTVHVRVQGPAWTTAERVDLYANGINIKSAIIAESDRKNAGVKWEGDWTLTGLQHDVHLVAIARGPGVQHWYWPTAKPYQPTTPDWQPYVMGSSGAIWVDIDQDNLPTAAYTYAQRLHQQADGDFKHILKLLSQFDEAVAVQAAARIHADGVDLFSPESRKLLSTVSTQTQSGFSQYLAAWRESQIARSETK